MPPLDLDAIGARLEHEWPDDVSGLTDGCVHCGHPNRGECPVRLRAEVNRLRTALATAEGERDEARRVGATEERGHVVTLLRFVARRIFESEEGRVAAVMGPVLSEAADRIERGEHVPGVKA